jgi:ATP-binding cassette subfamily B protein
MSKPDKKLMAKAVVGFYWRHIKQYPRLVVALLILLPITVLVNQIIPPIILAHVIFQLSRGNYTPDDLWGSFGPELIAYAVLAFSGSLILWRAIDWIVWRLEGRVLRDIAQEVFDHLTKQSADFHANHFGGSLVSQTNKLIGGYIRVTDTTIFAVIPLIFSVTFSVIVLAKSAPLFAVILFLFATAYATSAIFVTRKVRELGAKHAAHESAQTGNLADAITNVMAIKSFAGGTFENRRFAEATDKTFSSLVTLSRAHQRQQAYFSGMSSLIAGLSLTVAVISVLQFNADVAAVFLIFNYTALVSSQLFQFSNQSLRNYNRAIGDAGDMVAILGTQPEVLDPTKPQKARMQKGEIAFNNVVFQHAGSDDALFEKLSLHIKPGEKVGLVGHSGSGKTTLTRILLRFSDIDAGSITIDGQNIAHVTQDDLHRSIAYVPQEPLLFHRSIAENIRYGNPEASQDDVIKASRMASSHDFIEGLTHGYDTLVGERGVKLSGGQRQRIVIARALLKNAPVLILDEATSALDSESEALIQKALWKLMEGRTAIVIAHRLSTIQKMDRIIVLDNGEIIEQGSHKELLEQKGTYAKLWARQSGGFLDD